MDNNTLHNLAYKSLLEMVSEDGINASGKGEVYGCVFGRDSALTILKILRAHSKKPSLELLEVCRKALIKLTTLQGKEFNLESGEEPGKFIHEYRKDNLDRLLKLEIPWFVYPDKTIKNYDSLDSTPLGLIAIYKYYEATQDAEFLLSVLPAVEAGLNWIITFGDRDKDALLEYELPKERKHGGLSVQSWTDSHLSLTNKKGQMPKYPIAPAEVQGYAWLALKLWSDFYANHSPAFAQKLISHSAQLKQAFNSLFIFKSKGKHFVAQALDGDKKLIKTVTGNPMILLWASYEKNGEKESILEGRYIEDLVTRSFMNDMFELRAGIRTMSAQAPTFNPGRNSYHNGSFWPILNGLALEGLLFWGFLKEAKLLRSATVLPIEFFGSPIELYILGPEGEYLEYFEEGEAGQGGCREQAWSAATILELASDDSTF